jgi:hypothetical protein
MGCGICNSFDNEKKVGTRCPKRQEHLMTKQRKQSKPDPAEGVNYAGWVVANGITTIGDPVLWEVHPESIVEALTTASCYIPDAMSVSKEIGKSPTSWAGWWVRRMSLAKSLSDSGTGGNSSIKTVRLPLPLRV